MTIQVKLFGQLRTKVGEESLAIESNSNAAPDLGHVLDEIAGRHSAARGLLLKPDGTIAGGLLVFVDDAAAVPDRGLPLESASSITLLSAISGG